MAFKTLLIYNLVLLVGLKLTNSTFAGNDQEEGKCHLKTVKLFCSWVGCHKLIKEGSATFEISVFFRSETKITKRSAINEQNFHTTLYYLLYLKLG